IEVEVSHEPKQKLAVKNSVAQKAPHVVSRPLGPIHLLLGEVNQIESLNDTMSPAIAALQTEHTSAQQDLEHEIQNRQRYINEIDECRAKVDKELQELNAILRQIRLTELQHEPIEISGTVNDSHFKGIRA